VHTNPVSRATTRLKVVLFCGGLGLRMGESTARVPKPMIPIGDRPILWHIMKYYAGFGVRDFILCLGYKGEVIKRFFLEYNEALSNDFVLRDGGRHVELISSDIHDWSITFVDTGLQSTIGQRLRMVEQHLGDDEIFLANYGDTLTDAPLPDMVDLLRSSGATALFLGSHPTYSFHVATMDGSNRVVEIEDVTRAGLWINAGYFVFRREIFDYMREGEELVEEPFRRLIAEGKLLAYPYDGFWAPMDTLKEKHNLDVLLESGRAPWTQAHARALDGRPAPLEATG
jgi:glucose-1-phosphate cytidylyltransferase